MARRSIERTLLDLALSGVGVALIGIALSIMLVREYPLQLLAFCVGAFGARHYWNHWQGKKRVSDLEHAIRAADQQVECHKGALIAYYRQSVRRDQFGNEEARVWKRWITTFVDTQVRPELARLQLNIDDDFISHIAEHVDRRVRHIVASDDCADVADADSGKLSPEEYEQSCAGILFRRGWTVHPTPKTGDHGADIVAEKGGARLIVQCKLYAQPAGNKAVQEAYSACRLYSGTNACVVAPSGFTAHAERAAHGLSVRLLHHSQLEAFAEQLSASLTHRSKFS